MRTEFLPAYVLHTRPYRDTSLLIDFFTPEFGRIGAVARGVRQRKTGKRQLLNPFTPLLVSLQGRTDLKLLTGIEPQGIPLFLSGNAMFSGLYINELLMRLLPEQDSHTAVYMAYEQSLQQLSSGRDVEPVLRHFEFLLLEELGYALDFASEAYSSQPITPDSQYRYEDQVGFVPVFGEAAGSFSGDDLLALGQGDFSGESARRSAKRLVRQVLAPLLGNRPLRSRELFTRVESELSGRNQLKPD